MIKFVRDAIYSLERHSPTEKEIKSQIIDSLKRKWSKFLKNNLYQSNAQSKNWNKETFIDSIFTDIFSDDKSKIQA
jgi:hypothetical protein